MTPTVRHKRRMAIVIRQIDPTTASGKSALEHIKIFTQLGYEVTVVGDQLDSKMIQNLHAKDKSILKLPLGGYTQKQFFTWRADTYCREEKFDLVFGYGDHTFLDVYSVHNLLFLKSEWVDDQPLDPNDEKGKLHKKILTESNCKVILVESQLMRKELANRFNVEPSKIEVCYPGYNRETFNTKNKISHRATVRNQLNLNDNDIVIGFITHDGFKKHGFDYALNVFAKLDPSLPLKLLIFGNDNIESSSKLNYQQLANELGISDRIIFKKSISPTGEKTTPAIDELYHALDIFFLPARLDEFGHTILEAMACGLPVLASTHTGAAEFIQAKQLIKDPDDEAGWLAGLNELIQNKEWRKSIARQNADRALLLDEIHFHKRFVEILIKHNLILAEQAQ